MGLPLPLPCCINGQLTLNVFFLKQPYCSENSKDHCDRHIEVDAVKIILKTWPKGLQNSSVFCCFRKVASDIMTWDGRLFQTRSLATAKAQSPIIHVEDVERSCDWDIGSWQSGWYVTWPVDWGRPMQTSLHGCSELEIDSRSCFKPLEALQYDRITPRAVLEAKVCFC